MNTFLEAYRATTVSLAAKKENPYPIPSPILRASESFSTSLLQTLGVILLFVFLLQPLAPWLVRTTTQNHTYETIFPLPTSHLEKTTYDYDVVPGSSLYCNGDPVNGLDPDGRCVEGTAKGYTLGTFAEYDNTTQAIGGFVGTLASYATPGLGEAAFVRDVAGSAWHGLQAIGDMHSNGLNWRNGTTLGLSTLGVGVGAFAALVPAKAAVEAVASTTTIEETALVSKTPMLLPSSSGYNPWEGPIDSLVTKHDTIMYRTWGGSAGKIGAWLSPVKPASMLLSIRNLALPIENSAEFFSEVLVPAGTRYQIGKAASAFGQPGGDIQVLLLDRILPANFGPTIPLAPWL